EARMGRKAVLAWCDLLNFEAAVAVGIGRECLRVRTGAVTKQLAFHRPSQRAAQSGRSWPTPEPGRRSPKQSRASHVRSVAFGCLFFASQATKGIITTLNQFQRFFARAVLPAITQAPPHMARATRALVHSFPLCEEAATRGR